METFKCNDTSHMPNPVLKKDKSANPPLFNGHISSMRDKEQLLAEISSKNSNFDASGISLPAFLSKRELESFPVTPLMIKDVVESPKKPHSMELRA